MQVLPRTPQLTATDPETLRATVRHYFQTTYARYESLFQLLANDAAYYVKPIPLRHPLIFYLGHTATFYVNKLVLAGLLPQRLNPDFEALFAVGVDEMRWDDLDDRHYAWPPVAAVWAYRRQVQAQVDALIQHWPLTPPITWEHPWWVILMGIEHERIHLETSSVLIRQHDLAYVRPHLDWAPCREYGEPPANTWVSIPAGTVRLGGDFAEPIYGWDNEYGVHQAEVPGFQAARYLVTQREFLGFVNAGGYADAAWWDAEGWAWRTFAQAQHPTFWRRVGGAWHLRLLAEAVPMPWDWPVETNCHEARAFCRWQAQVTGLAVRLPTEDEWHRLYDFVGGVDVPQTQRAQANLHLDHYASSTPVTRFTQGALADVTGNVWQWTETPIHPFAGFKVHPLYDDFSVPTFDDQHNLIKGGSWISTGNESRAAARYAFRRHFFQHAGFRPVVGAAPARAVSSVYETDALLAQYVEFHYGADYFGVTNFPQTLADLAVTADQRHGNGRWCKALDLGCATGRASFALAHHFAQVIGVDFSARFIQAGAELVAQGMLRYVLPEEGELQSYHECSLAQFGLDTVRTRVEFWQGDACNLKPHLTGFDLILAANLIDRLYDPRQFLAQVHERLTPGGLLVLSSPYTWLTEHTPRAAWLGGFKRDGERYTTLAGLAAVLGAHFDLVENLGDVPFVIRETRRKFQHSLAEVTVWRLRT